MTTLGGVVPARAASASREKEKLGGS